MQIKWEHFFACTVSFFISAHVLEYGYDDLLRWRCVYFPSHLH